MSTDAQLPQATRERIDAVIGSNKVVLFMKGTPQMPQCGFSAATIGILDTLVADYATVNVLEDQEVREGIKAYSSWPTIPQLYIEKEFVGGCDIVKQMFNTGALHEVLGQEAPDRSPPEIHLSDEAAEVIRGALADQDGAAVFLQIDARWQHSFNIGRPEGHEVVAEANGLSIYMDVGTAGRARGLKIDMTENLQGRAFAIDNPNAPATVKQMSPPELKAKMDAGDGVYVFDVRPPAERGQASIEGARALDDEGTAFLESLPKDAEIVFMCHVGQRSQAAAEHFRLQGHANVYNLTGGIEAWSLEVDSSVPRY